MALSTSSQTPVEQPLEQLLYARWLERATWLGSVALALIFANYISGWGSPYVALERLPVLWQLPLKEFLTAADMPRGWGWLALSSHTDLANLMPVAMLAGSSMIALLALIWHCLRQKQWVFAVLCIAQTLILLLAASGLLGSGR